MEYLLLKEHKGEKIFENSLINILDNPTQHKSDTSLTCWE